MYRKWYGNRYYSKYHLLFSNKLPCKKNKSWRKHISNHGDDWKIVECLLIADFDRSTIEKYKANNAIILSINHEEITIIDLNGYAILELKCEYREAVEYLEYLFYSIRPSWYLINS